MAKMTREQFLAMVASKKKGKKPSKEETLAKLAAAKKGKK